MIIKSILQFLTSFILLFCDYFLLLFPLHVELNFDLPQESVVTDAITALQDNEPSFTELNLNNHPLVNSNHLDQIMVALKDNSYVEHVSLVNVKMVDKHSMVCSFFAHLPFYIRKILSKK